MTGIESKEAAKAAIQIATQTGTGQQQKPVDTAKLGDSPFMKILDQHQDNMNVMNEELLKAFGSGPTQHPADSAVSAKGLDIDVSAAQKVGEVSSPNKAAGLLSELNRGGLQMDRIVELVTSGNRFSNSELLLLQAGLQRISLDVEIYVKIADAAKTIPQTMINRYGGQ